MSVHWNKTNRAFTDRISEAQDAHRNLKSNLILTKNVSTFSLYIILCAILDVAIWVSNHILKHNIYT